MLDDRWIRSLHVAGMRHAELDGDHHPHALFQASTIGALVDGAYDGDLTFAELAEHGGFGLGTVNALDGEMIALDGAFLRADADGHVHAIDPGERTPFAVVCDFEPAIDTDLASGLDHNPLLARLDEFAPSDAASFAVRLEGRFESVRLRSVPAQHPPYRPLTQVLEDQHVFELTDIRGSMVGFSFPAYVEGIEVAGHHLHFVSEDRTRGGHVLGSRTSELRVRIDPSNELRVELPPGIDLTDGDLAAETHEAIEAAEHRG